MALVKGLTIHCLDRGISHLKPFLLVYFLTFEFSCWYCERVEQGHAAARSLFPSKVNSIRRHDNAGPAGMLDGGCYSHTAARPASFWVSPCQQHVCWSSCLSHLQPPVLLKERSKRSYLSFPLLTCRHSWTQRRSRAVWGRIWQLFLLLSDISSLVTHAWHCGGRAEPRHGCVRPKWGGCFHFVVMNKISCRLYVLVIFTDFNVQ